MNGINGLSLFKERFGCRRSFQYDPVAAGQLTNQMAVPFIIDLAEDTLAPDELGASVG